MAVEPNLFGEPQERNPPPPNIKFYFSCDAWAFTCEGIGEIEPGRWEVEYYPMVKVLEWIEEPDWTLEELEGQDRSTWPVDPREDEVEVLERELLEVDLAREIADKHREAA